jgi:sugar lactone lactonase YvrE
MQKTMLLSGVLFLLQVFVTKPWAQSPAPMRIGQWRSLLPYRSGPQVTQGPEKIYYATELSVLSLDKKDLSVDYFSREDGLSNVGIRTIRYNPFARNLMVVYANSAIDVIDGAGKVSTLNQIRNFKNFIGEKYIYDLYVADSSVVYIAANYGVSRVNPGRGEFVFTTFTGLDVTGVTVFNGYIYLATEAGLYRIRENSGNPQNFGNWEFMGPRQGFPGAYRTQVLCVYNGMLYFDVNQVLYRINPTGTLELVHRLDGFRLQFLSAEGKNLLAGYRCTSPGCGDIGRVLYFNGQGLAATVDGSCTGQPNYAVEDEQGRVWFGDNYRNFRYLERLGGGACKLLSFNSPYSSNNRRLVVNKGQLWVASGGVNQTFSYLFLDHGFSSFVDGKWTVYNRDTRVELKGENPVDPDDDLYDIMTIAIHPDNGKVYAGSFFEGLLELDGDKMKLYNDKNSTLNNAVGDSRRTRVGGLAFDSKGRLWVGNHLAARPISVLLPDGTWKSFRPSCGETQLHEVLVDANGYKWLLSSSSASGFLVFDEGNIDNELDDRCRLFTAGNSNLPTNAVNCFALDLDGDVWVGTAQGIVIFECGRNIFDPAVCRGTLRPVEQDGFLEYLLSTEEVQAIAVDGGNRKWVGTKRGVFLLSADGREQLQRFTIENSPLPDNSINHIAVDQLSGRVYIGTEKGIITYQSDAVAGDRLHSAAPQVFPNPVPPDYSGPIAIRGLSRDAVVKITDISGKLVFQTEALGGQAIWNGNDYLGRPVRSGVYLVFSASNPRESGFFEPTSAVARIVVQR